MIQAQPNPQSEDLPQRRWNVGEYHHMIAVGILSPNDRNRKAKVYAKADIPEY